MLHIAQQKNSSVNAADVPASASCRPGSSKATFRFSAKSLAPTGSSLHYRKSVLLFFIAFHLLRSYLSIGSRKKSTFLTYPLKLLLYFPLY